MKMKAVVFIGTVFIFTFVGEFRYEVPALWRLAVAEILLGAALISLAIAWRRDQTTDP